MDKNAVSHQENLALLNADMKCPLPKGEGTRVLAPFSLWERARVRVKSVLLIDRFSNAANLLLCLFPKKTKAKSFSKGKRQPDLCSILKIVTGQVQFYLKVLLEALPKTDEWLAY